MVRRSWARARAELTAVLERCAGPSLSRFALEGPATALGPQMSVGLCMIVHELMTNSLKYGALSADEGRIDIRWSTEGDRLRLTWAETGGPPVEAPSRRGFGSVLIGRLAKHEMSGTVDHDYRPDGLVFTADLILEAEDRWTSQFN